VYRPLITAQSRCGRYTIYCGTIRISARATNRRVVSCYGTTPSYVSMCAAPSQLLQQLPSYRFNRWHLSVPILPASYACSSAPTKAPRLYGSFSMILGTTTFSLSFASTAPDIRMVWPSFITIPTRAKPRRKYFSNLSAIWGSWRCFFR